MGKQSSIDLNKVRIQNKKLDLVKNDTHEDVILVDEVAFANEVLKATCSLKKMSSILLAKKRIEHGKSLNNTIIE